MLPARIMERTFLFGSTHQQRARDRQIRRRADRASAGGNEAQIDALMAPCAENLRGSFEPQFCAARHSEGRLT